MKRFDYVIKDKVGIHARPAGVLVKAAGKYESAITMVYGDESADVSRLLSVMGLGVKCGDMITLEIEGADEDAACEGMKLVLEENL